MRCALQKGNDDFKVEPFDPFAMAWKKLSVTLGEILWVAENILGVAEIIDFWLIF